MVHNVKQNVRRAGAPDQRRRLNPNPNPNPNPDPMAEVCTASPTTLSSVSNNSSAHAGSVDVFDETLTATGSTYSPGNNERIAFDAVDRAPLRWGNPRQR